MHTDIVAAFIVVVGVIAQVVVSYLISRQSANDLRPNIDREIDVIRKLRSGSKKRPSLRPMSARASTS